MVIDCNPKHKSQLFSKYWAVMLAFKVRLEVTEMLEVTEIFKSFYLTDIGSNIL